MNEWISVDKELPEGVTSFKTMSEFVLVNISAARKDECGVGYGRYCHDRKRWFAGLFMFSPDLYEVTHWQKVPEPPKP